LPAVFIHQLVIRLLYCVLTKIGLEASGFNPMCHFVNQDEVLRTRVASRIFFGAFTDLVTEEVVFLKETAYVVYGK